MIRSADLISYTAEAGLRFFGEGQLLASDSFPGQDRTKLCLASKVRACCGLSARLWLVSACLGLAWLAALPCLRRGRPSHAWVCAARAARAAHRRLACAQPPSFLPRRPAWGVAQVPLGVVLAIPPFNYPVNLAVRWGFLFSFFLRWRREEGGGRTFVQCSARRALFPSLPWLPPCRCAPAGCFQGACPPLTHIRCGRLLPPPAARSRRRSWRATAWCSSRPRRGRWRAS